MGLFDSRSRCLDATPIANLGLDECRCRVTLIDESYSFFFAVPGTKTNRVDLPVENRLGLLRSRELLCCLRSSLRIPKIIDSFPLIIIIGN